ncbi:MAG: hypothetical protein WCS37_12925 [Chloroflexota bacterium]|nr:hypothetical protein [Chloroflexota bacterium]
MSEKDVAPHESDEYAMMLTLEQLETLLEELEEVGFGTLGEIEAALALTAPTGTPSLDQRRETLQEMRDQMRELHVANAQEIQEQINKLNEQLDAL